MGTYSKLLQKDKSSVVKEARKVPVSEAQTVKVVDASMLASKHASNIASKKASMLEMEGFSEDDIATLRQSTYKQLNVRGTEREAEWLKDTAYQLSKAVKRGRVDQADIIRVGIRLFKKLLEGDKSELIKVLEEMN